MRTLSGPGLFEDNLNIEKATGNLLLGNTGISDTKCRVINYSFSHASLEGSLEVSAEISHISELGIIVGYSLAAE